MKVCKYCGTENDNKAKTCSSCGANDFKYKCGNCGNEFEDGFFCPKCGVKTGQKMKECPVCGTEYYSNACPNCGYKDGDKSTTISDVYVTTVEPKKKRKTWLWVLGWIYIFPIPLTVLMVRSQKFKKGVKTGIIAAAWIVYLIIGLSINSG